jgi:glutamate racemase
MLSSHHQPIGIFDSGVGGLTTAFAVNSLLPNENIVYFGDVAHHPYGEKSASLLQNYTLKICDFLLQQNVKLILIACHSASSSAYETARNFVGTRAIVMNVIDPVIHYLKHHFKGKNVGLIGTKHTIHSQVYYKKIKGCDTNISLNSLATPLLAPMIEEGYAGHGIIDAVLSNYLSHPDLKNIQALLLACTHYPLIKPQINKYYQSQSNPLKPMTLIDSAEITSFAVKNTLEEKGLLKPESDNTVKTSHKFYVSDYTHSFVENARHFFPNNLHFELYPLWD